MISHWQTFSKPCVSPSSFARVCVCVCLGQGQNLKLTNPAVWPLCLSPFPPSTAMSLHDRLTNDLAKPWVARPLADWARLRRTMHELPACLLSAWLSLRITSAPVTAWALTPPCIATPRQRQGGQKKRTKLLSHLSSSLLLMLSCSLSLVSVLSSPASLLSSLHSLLRGRACLCSHTASSLLPCNSCYTQTGGRAQQRCLPIK